MRPTSNSEAAPEAIRPNRPAGRYKTVTFTDLEKKANGHPTGRYTKTFTIAHFPPGELEKIIEGMRREQQEKNDAFKRRTFVNGIEGVDQQPCQSQRDASPARSPSDVRQWECPACGAPLGDPLGDASPKVGLQTSLKTSLKSQPPFDKDPPTASPTIALQLDAGTGNSTALLGSSKRGKSTCMMHLYRQYFADKEQISTLFASNPQLPMYAREKRDKRLIVCQTYEPKLIKLAAAINRKTKNAYNFCFLLDDIVDKRDDVVLKELILTLRNSNLSSVVCLQYSNLLAKMARANVNNLLLFGFNSDEAIELVCQQFLAGHLRERKIPKDDWSRYYREATKNHGFIYVHPSSGEISYHRLPPPAQEP